MGCVSGRLAFAVSRSGTVASGVFGEQEKTDGNRN